MGHTTLIHALKPPHRKRPKSIFVRHSGKLSGLAVLFLTATVIYLHSHRRTLHSHLAAKDYQLNAIVEEKEAISRTLREKDHKVSVKTVESEHLRRTIERLQEEVSTQSTRALEATRLAEETTRASAAKIKALEERLQADTARYTSQVGLGRGLLFFGWGCPGRDWVTSDQAMAGQGGCHA